MALVGPTMTVLSSKNELVTVPEAGPLALTMYVATNDHGRTTLSVSAPVRSAVTSSLQVHVFPTLSLTKRWMRSPGAQPAPDSLTVSPGE